MKRLVYVSGMPGAGKSTLACPPDIAITRYRTRPRHPVHATAAHRPETELAQFDQPVGIGSLITVDTTTPVDVPAVASEVRRLQSTAGIAPL